MNTPDSQQDPIRPVRLAHPDRFYIGGEWVTPSSGDSIDVIRCSDETVVASIAEARDADIDRAVSAARRAFDEGPWPRMSHAERATYLRAIAAAFQERSDDFAQVWTEESGILYKLSQARIGGWMNVAFNTYADMAETFPFRESHRSATGLQGYIYREPVGVVAAIIPWNGPAPMIAYKCAPALLAGCPVIVKPSPEAPRTAYLMAELCEEVGLPPGVFNMATADREVSEGLVRHAGVDKVTFTGSTAAGSRIASICGERMARCTMELGGKSPAVILDDYELESAAEAIGSGVGYLTGQVCHSLTRVIVPRTRHDDMVDALCAKFASLTVGDPFDPATDVGPLATAQQRARVEGYVEKGTAEGARLACGGQRPANLDRGYYFEPTVFADVDNASTIAQEEIFGPVLSVIRADDEEHAITLANDTVYGLNASVFTNDTDRFEAVARRLRSGTVGQNASRTDFTISFGGVKQSGFGREGGTDGLVPFLEPKTVVVDRPFGE